MPVKDMEMAAWTQLLKQRFTHRYKVVYGGRGSGKTYGVAQTLVLIAVERPVRVVCLREVQKSMKESSMQVLRNTIEAMGLRSRFAFTQDRITSKTNGSVFMFQGMSTSTEESIKGLEDVDYAWFEEAHRMSHSSWELLFPTIRKPGSEIWLTFNPKNRYDAVYETFVNNTYPGAWTHKVNWNDNPWFPQKMDEDRRTTLQMTPDRYDHIWEGMPDDEGDQRKVLPYSLVRECVDAFEQHRPESNGRIQAGLDVADTGADKNALAARVGPTLIHLDQWRADTLGITTRRTHAYCNQTGVSRLHYDVGGVGAGVRSILNDLDEHRVYSAYPINFGSAPTGGDRQFTRKQTNKDWFENRGAQMAWALHLRAQRTRRLMDGQDESTNVNVDRCLLIPPDTPHLKSYLAQLSQPEWGQSARGRLTVEKQPKITQTSAEAPSPDMYDATALAFAYDSNNGLRESY